MGRSLASLALVPVRQRWRLWPSRWGVKLPAGMACWFVEGWEE